MNIRTMPYRELNEISPDGEFILFDVWALNFSPRRFSDFKEFVRRAFDEYEDLHSLYPVREETTPFLNLR